MDNYISNVKFNNGHLIFSYTNGIIQDIDLA